MSVTTTYNDLMAKLRRDYADCQKAMRQFPVDLYFLFALKFFESYAYFALSQVIVIYIHDEFGASDIEAGFVYGMFGAAITGWGLLLSWVNDNLGIKNSLTLGFTISAVSSTIVACTRSKILLYVTLFAFYPIGLAFGLPMLTIATKRYTTTKNRGFAFGLYYAIMNLAALVSGGMVDAFNIGIPDDVEIGSSHWSGYRFLIFTCTVGNLISVAIVYFRLREIKVCEEVGDRMESHIDTKQVLGSTCSTGKVSECVHIEMSDGVKLIENARENLDENDEQSGAESSLSPLHLEEKLPKQQEKVDKDKKSDTLDVEEFQPSTLDPLTVLKDLLHSPTFRRFAVLTLFLVNLRAIFRHLDATQPTYLVRCFGDNVPKGTLYSINPFMIIFLTPVVAAMTNTYNHFDMIKWGGYVSAASPFFLAGSTSIWACACMNVVLSLGEAIWSPRLYDYVMSIAPEGREASFSALANAPLFAAKIPVGLMSGYLLSTYVPEDTHCNGTAPQMMWLIIALMTMSSPILITIFDPCIREPLHNRKSLERKTEAKPVFGSNAKAIELRDTHTDDRDHV